MAVDLPEHHSDPPPRVWTRPTLTYMDFCGTTDGHLVIFNRDPDVPWEDKIFHRTETCREIPIHIWGM